MARLPRRRFLTNAAAGAAAIVSAPAAAHAQQQQADPPPADVYATDKPGSDHMADVLKSLGFEYVAANPGSTFRGLHESFINYGHNANPELLTCCHEESSVAMAHGYAKIEGKPMLVMAHGTVGLQHASMAIYNAFADRVPVYVLLGNIADVAWRRSDVEWTHAVQDAAAMVRDYTKWDDAPRSLGHFGESAVRAYKIAMTPPQGPVVIVADAVMQEEAVPQADRGKLRVPRLSPTSPPAADSGAVAELARMLVAADNPVIVAGRAARTPKGIPLLVELAELLQAPVNDGHQFTLRMNFPSRHPLKGAGVIANADLVVGLEVPDFYLATHAITPVNRFGMESRQTTKAGAKLVTISASDLLTKSNYQESGRYAEVDLAIPADPEATLPSLIEACKRLITPDRKASVRRARRETRGGITPGARGDARARGVGLGCESDLDGAALRGNLEPGEGPRLVAGIATPRSSATGRCGCGTSRSTISSSAGRARTESATVRPRRSAPLWPIAGTGVSASTSSATAI